MDITLKGNYSIGTELKDISVKSKSEIGDNRFGTKKISYS